MTAERVHSTVFPFSWYGWDGDMDAMIHYDVIFREDFGPWKKNERIDNLTIEYDQGRVVQFDHEGKEVKSARFQAKVIKYDGPDPAGAGVGDLEAQES